jgi:uncharacterized membrane protein HdeD (DUF308 family)
LSINILLLGIKGYGIGREIASPPGSRCSGSSVWTEGFPKECPIEQKCCLYITGREKGDSGEFSMAETVPVPEPSHVKWSSYILRGLVALIIGFLVILWAGLAVEVVVMLIGFLLLFASFQALVLALKAPKGVSRPVPLIVMGVLGLIVGIIAVLFPWIAAVALTLIIAILMLFAGFIDIATAVFHPEFTRHRYVLALTGAIAVILGGIYFLFPVLGAMVMVIVYLGFFALLYGVLSIVTGFMVKGEKKAAAA